MEKPFDIDFAFNDVIEKLKVEFEYSKKWDYQRAEEGKNYTEFDQHKPVESWILWMEHYLGEARKEASINTDKKSALNRIREVANLAIVCLVYQGCPPREE